MKKPWNAYKGIFFDAGDTLITIPEAQLIIVDYLAERSIELSEQAVSKSLQFAFDQLYIQKKKDPAALCSPESERKYWMELYRFVLDHLDIQDHLSEEEIHHCCHELFDLYLSPDKYILFDDVKPALDQIRQAGIRIGLVSNFASQLREILRDKGVLDYFDPLIISAEIGLEKPNPDIFHKALEMAGLDGGDVLYIGDHETNDIWAPAQAGMDTVRIIRYSYQHGEGIRSLKELFEV